MSTWNVTKDDIPADSDPNSKQVCVGPANVKAWWETGQGNPGMKVEKCLNVF